MKLQEWIDGTFEETDTDYKIAGMNILQSAKINFVSMMLGMNIYLEMEMIWGFTVVEI